jgi:cyclophilin family peptidyl-prolyl cis-trans isomerase
VPGRLDVNRIVASRVAGLLLLLCTPVVSAAERVEIETSKGVIAVDLFTEQAPATVANFLRHVDARFYDGLVFHRVVPGFVIQGGGYEASFAAREPLGKVLNESRSGPGNARGTLAMARTNDPDSATSQFFVNLVDNPNLDARAGRPGYTVFGRVSEGMAVVDAIGRVPTSARQGLTDVPVEPVVILAIRRVAPPKPVP